MQSLTEQGTQKIAEIAQRYGISTDAAMSMLRAVVNGRGSMAQFDIPELGGSGQWMQGGMTMVGDMFNHGLKSRVEGLCSELSQLLAQQPFIPQPASDGQSQWQGGGHQQQQQQGGGHGFGAAPQGGNSFSLFVPGPAGGSGSWWPAELGSPSGSGGQNNVRYAYFSDAHRLAVDINGNVTVYDTLDHRIGGVSQQQGAGGSVTLTSQHGTVDVASLPVVSAHGAAPEPSASHNVAPSPSPPPSQSAAPSSPSGAGNSREPDILATIERLAALKEKGIISPEEFATKKTELLGRL